MARISFDIPDNQLARLINAYSEGYQETIQQEDGTSIPNPQTKQQYARRRIIEDIRERIRNYEIHVRIQEAQNQPIDPPSIT